MIRWVQLRGMIVTEHVKIEVPAGIMKLTLPCAEKRKALSNGLYTAMSDRLKRADKELAVLSFYRRGRATALGQGTMSLSSMVKRMKDAGDSQPHRLIGNLGKATLPVIAAVQGNTVGIGTAYCSIAAWLSSPIPEGKRKHPHELCLTV